jgi:multidrug resistance efflux pump
LEINRQINNMASKYTRRHWILASAAVIVVVVAAVILVYMKDFSGKISISNSMVEAPLITLGPTQGGELNDVLVNVGDSVLAGAPVAEVGTEIIRAKVAGLIVATETTIGEQVSPGDAVVTEIDPTQLRVVGQIDENKGLDKIQVGDRATFTVDAFGSEQFAGTVDEISPTADQSALAFSISSDRPTQTFDIKVRFDVSQYPELKNGMSARLSIYTQ